MMKYVKVVILAALPSQVCSIRSDNSDSNNIADQNSDVDSNKNEADQNSNVEDSSDNADRETEQDDLQTEEDADREVEWSVSADGTFIATPTAADVLLSKTKTMK